ncbi:MAG: polyhydroxyalkanoate synthesis regulator DNA-binding domain-containing protein [Desulfobacterales bacterium]
MLTIKKYANGRLYDTENKKYITQDELAGLIKKKTKVKVILSKTGKDITKSFTAKLSSKPKSKKSDRGIPKNIKKWIDENKKWFGDNVEKQLDKLLDVMNLPTKEQISKLTSSIESLNKKVKNLEKLQKKKQTNQRTTGKEAQ